MTGILIAQLRVNGAGVYLLLGLAFAIACVRRGAGQIDPAAANGTLGFRLIILPGAVLLWPWLAKRWWRGAPRAAERNAHRDAALRSNFNE